MKYSKRTQELFLQRFYVPQNNIGQAVCYHNEWCSVKKVISVKQVRLAKIPQLAKTDPSQPIVDACECRLHYDIQSLYDTLSVWIRNNFNCTLISNWNTAKKKGGLKHSDMFQYTTKEEVWEDVRRVLGRETRREHKKILKASGVKLVHKTNTHSIFKLLTYEGAVVLGKNTKWCISSTYKPDVGRSTFNDYSQRSDMFVIIDRRTNEKWCVLFSRDARRHSILVNLLGVRPIFKKKITGFNQKDVEIEEKQLFLAIKGIAEEGREEEFLREVFERYASPVSCESVHSEVISMRMGMDAGLEVDRYGMRDRMRAAGVV